jgi:hypothetical protein
VLKILGSVELVECEEESLASGSPKEAGPHSDE